MALDHTREFFSDYRGNPVDLTKASAAIFLTRFITHYCAPVFFFLAGTGAFLAFDRGKSKAELTRFLVTRGLWLVVLEVTVVRCLGFAFNFDYSVTAVTVLWALGWSMVALAALIHLVFAIGMIALHNLLDGVSSKLFGAWSRLWVILHEPGFVRFGTVGALFAYPLIPWIGVMAAGFAFGALFRRDAAERRLLLKRIGIGLTLAFVLLRAANFYGDPRAWQPQKDWLFTMFSFLNCNKYPPSLLFLLMTLGPAILFLAWSNGVDASRPGRLTRFVVVVGRVPLFFYLLHLPLIHGLAVLFAWVRYGTAAFLFKNPSQLNFPFEGPPGYGYSLWVIYAVWVGVVFALYPACRWFADLKQRRRETWLRYL
jgi:uncharacterized membrane protein